MTVDCHHCEHQESVAAGKYSGVAWENTPCGRCQYEDRDSRYTIEYDAERDGGVYQPVADAGGKDNLPMAVMVDAVSMMVDMPMVALRIVRGRLAKQTYVEIGEELGISAARVETLHQRAMERWPALRALFPVKMARARRREGELERIRAGLPKSGHIPEGKPRGCGRKGSRGKGRKTLAANQLREA